MARKDEALQKIESHEQDYKTVAFFQKTDHFENFSFHHLAAIQYVLYPSHLFMLGVHTVWLLITSKLGYLKRIFSIKRLDFNNNKDDLDMYPTIIKPSKNKLFTRSLTFVLTN